MHTDRNHILISSNVWFQNLKVCGGETKLYFPHVYLRFKSNYILLFIIEVLQIAKK